MVEAAGNVKYVISGGEHKLEAGNYGTIVIEKGACVFTDGEVHAKKIIVKGESSLDGENIHAGKLVSRQSKVDIADARVAVARSKAKPDKGVKSTIELDALAKHAKWSGNNSKVSVANVDLNEIAIAKNEKISTGFGIAAMTIGTMGWTMGAIDKTTNPDKNISPEASSTLATAGIIGILTMLIAQKGEFNIGKVKAKDIPQQ